MKQKKITMRMCVGCKELKPKKELLRVVALPTGIIELDRTGKKSGRGVYVCDNIECFEKAYESHGLEKSLKRPVSKEVYDSLKEQIEKDDPVYRMLGLCMKAGRLLSGSEQVSEGLRKGTGKLLIIAEDSSPRTKEEYTNAAEKWKIPYRVFGEKDKLGQALGKGVRTAALIVDKGFGKAIAEKIDNRK